MLILDLLGISFHAVVVLGLGKNLLFKSILGRCDMYQPFQLKKFEKAGILIDRVFVCLFVVGDAFIEG